MGSPFYPDDRLAESPAAKVEPERAPAVDPPVLPLQRQSKMLKARPTFRPWQWSLTTLLLLTATVASWTAWYRASEERKQLQREIAGMEELTRKLVVSDPSEYAAVKLLEEWNDENRWKVYLPPGAEYQLKLATEHIDTESFPTPDHQMTLSPGEHALELITEGQAKKDWRVIVRVDNDPAIELPKAADWHTGSGWNESGSFTRSEQAPIDRPLVLKRRRYMRAQQQWEPKPPPTSGILLWIESSAITPAAAK